MQKKISELPDVSSGGVVGITNSDFLVVVDSETLTTGRSTIKSVVEKAAPLFIKLKTNAIRGDAFVEGKPPIDEDFKFDSINDNIGEGIFEVEFIGFFNQAPPIAYIDSNIVSHGLQKIYKVAFTPRPEDRENIADINAGTVSGYVTVNSEIKSLIFPNINLDSDSDSDSDSPDYEPMFFYETDSTFPQVGYYLEIKLIVNISSANPLNFRWCSAVSGENTTLVSGEIQLTKLNQIN